MTVYLTVLMILFYRYRQMSKLTATGVKQAKIEDKQYKMTDGAGMYLLVKKSGKYWRLDYRFDGKRKTLALGTYPGLSLKESRSKRDEARKLLSNNIDPGAKRKAEKMIRKLQVENSFEAISREWFEKKKKEWSENHSNRIIKRLENNVFPYLGSESIVDINTPTVLSVIRKIEKRGAYETAHRALSNCGQIFRYAIATGRLERDPTYKMHEGLQPAQKTHLAAVTDPVKVAEVLRAIDIYNGTLSVQCALRLAPLVFVRPGELRQAEWKDVNFESREWRYLITKTKTDHIVPLANQAIEILNELQPLTGHGRYLFPSARNPKGDRPMSDNAILAALRRMGIAKDEMSGHGFRAMARTILDEELGFRVDFIEHQLAHAVKDPNGRAYNRTSHLKERKVMMQAWADYLDQLKHGAGIIELRAGGI